MKLWEKDFSLDSRIESFTTGRDRELDLQLARWDIEGSLAHIAMLEHIGLLTTEEKENLDKELKDILINQVESGEFVIEKGVEDVHSQIELELTRRLGDTGKKIHSGRSRNDQVLVDLKLFFRHEIGEITTRVHTLFRTLQKRSEENRNVLMPGYTHMQVAMPSSFGLWFGAFAEGLVDDVWLLSTAYRVTDQNPLGSAAGYGSSFPLDRKMTTERLGFGTMAYNVVHAQMGRGKTERILSYALASVASTVGKMAMDICLYNGQNYSFFSLPDEFTTGSSIMPHKKNPDVFELIRGKCNQLQALPAVISQVQANLPSGYHREMQLLKENLFPAIEDVKTILEIFDYAVAHLQVARDLLENDIYRYISTVEEVNRRVLSGTPFRDAYREVARDVESGEFTPDGDTTYTHEGSIGNLMTVEIEAKMNEALQGIPRRGH